MADQPPGSAWIRKTVHTAHKPSGSIDSPRQPSGPPGLAGGTEDRGTLLKPDTPERCPAAGARQTGLSVHLVHSLKRTPRTIGSPMVPDRAATLLDRSLQHPSDRPSQGHTFPKLHLPSRTERMHAGAKERLVGIDVADAGDHGLIQQDRLHGPSRALKDPVQPRAFNSQRVGAEAVRPCTPHRMQMLMRLEPAEPARITMQQSQLGSIGQVETPLGVHMAIIGSRIGSVDQAKRTAHAQMHQQATVPGRFDHQLLAVSVQGLHGRSARQGNGSGRDDHVGSTHLDRSDPCAHQLAQ